MLKLIKDMINIPSNNVYHQKIVAAQKTSPQGGSAMLNAKLDGQIIFINEYIGYDDETAVDKIKELKLSNRSGRLTCCDDDCGQPVEFCHGPIKGSYFRHKKGYGDSCQYNAYSSDRQSFDALKVLLYKHFSDQGLEVTVDTKLLPGHWTDLALKFPSGKIVAIELTDHRTDGSDHITYHDLYVQKGISDLWILQTAPAEQENLRDMHVSDMMNYAKSNQKLAVYFDTESKNITVRSEYGMNVRFPHLLQSKFISVTMPVSSFELDGNGNIVGRYIDLYRNELDRIHRDYCNSEQAYIQRIKIEEENRRKQAEEERKRQEEQARMLLRKKEAERLASSAFESEKIPIIKSVLTESGITIDNEKFSRFIEKNNNWLRNAYEPGKNNNDMILCSKYKSS